MRNKSKAALFVCYLLMFYTGVFYYPRWKQERTENTISWDVSGYYMYLPAYFIYKDLRQCRFKDSILDKYGPTPDFQQAFIHKASGNYVMKYPAGQAILMTPYFFIGHQVALHSGGKYPPDGFSFPYQLSIGLGMLLYAFIGLFVFRKVLLHYFKDGTVALTLIALVFGSNYLNYAAIDQSMTHSTLFMLYALILWCCIKFYERPRVSMAIALGALTGMATLTRPTEILSVILPVLWGVSSIKGFRERVRFFFKQPVYLLLFVLFFILPVSVQLVYWKKISGDWIVYSYQDQGFSWLHPHLKDYMFSYDTGWLRYAPMLLLSFVGVIPFVAKKKNLWAVLFFMFLNLYVVTAWDIWWFGGRAMVQSYAVMFFPVAALIEYVNEGKAFLKWLFYPVYFLFIYLNFWWTHGAHRGKVQTSNISEAYYWHMVGRWSATEEDTKLLDDPDRYKGSSRNEHIIYQNDFEQDTSANRTDEGLNGAGIFIDKEHENTAAYTIPLPPKGAKWIRASADFKIAIKEWDPWKMPQFIVKAYYRDKEVKANLLRMHRFLNEQEPRNVFMDVRLPREPYDKLVVTFWNATTDRKTVIDNVKITVLE